MYKILKITKFSVNFSCISAMPSLPPRQPIVRQVSPRSEEHRVCYTWHFAEVSELWRIPKGSGKVLFSMSHPIRTHAIPHQLNKY